MEQQTRIKRTEQQNSVLMEANNNQAKSNKLDNKKK